MSIFRPTWFNQLSLDHPEQRRTRNRYLIKSAALVYDPSGSLQLLAGDLGIAYHSLVRLYGEHGGVISPQMAVRIEKTIGREILPRKLLRPDIFE